VLCSDVITNVTFLILLIKTAALLMLCMVLYLPALTAATVEWERSLAAGLKCMITKEDGSDRCVQVQLLSSDSKNAGLCEGNNCMLKTRERACW